MTVRNALITTAAVGAAALGGAGIAGAASGTTSSSSSASSHQAHTVNGRSETPLSGATAAKVKAAALAKVSGTVERLETNVDGSAPYEAHITKSDGTSVEVRISKDLAVEAVNTMDHHG